MDQFNSAPQTQPHLDYRQIVLSVIGQGSSYTSLAQGSTAQCFPELSGFGEYARCDHIVTGTIAGLAFQYAFPVRVYPSARDREFNHFSFNGNCLTIKVITESNPLYACTGKPFSRPRGEGWLEAPRAQELFLWSWDNYVTVAQHDRLLKYIQWLEQELCVVLSYRYAVYIDYDRISVLFDEPFTYEFRKQLQLVKRALSRFGTLNLSSKLSS